jgi:hypothetical protein
MILLMGYKRVRGCIREGYKEVFMVFWLLLTND